MKTLKWLVIFWVFLSCQENQGRKIDSSKSELTEKLVSSADIEQIEIDSYFLKMCKFLRSKKFDVYGGFPNPKISRQLDTLWIDEKDSILIYHYNRKVKIKEYYDTTLMSNWGSSQAMQSFIRQLYNCEQVNGITYNKKLMYIDQWQFKDEEGARMAMKYYEALRELAEIFPKTYSSALVQGKNLYIFHAFFYWNSRFCKQHRDWMRDSVIGLK